MSAAKLPSSPRGLLRRWAREQQKAAAQLLGMLPSLSDADCLRLGRALAPSMALQGKVLERFTPERARARRGKAAA